MKQMEQITKILKSVNISNDEPINSEEYQRKLYEIEKEKIALFNNEVGSLDREDGHNCDICKNRGYMWELGEYGNGFTHNYVPCECMKVRSMIKKIQKSGLKNIMLEYTFDKYIEITEWHKNLKDRALNFIKDNSSDWFFIGGQSGAGKTHLCTAITTSYLKQNIAAQYMLWRDDVTKIKALVNDVEEYHKIVDELKTVPVLYIDDLFKMGKNNQGIVQPPTVADINLAYEIINYRYNNKGLVTIISSEYTIGDLVKIDEALGGRISEKTAANGYCINIKKDISKNYRLHGIIEM